MVCWSRCQPQFSLQDLVEVQGYQGDARHGHRDKQNHKRKDGDLSNGNFVPKPISFATLGCASSHNQCNPSHQALLRTCRIKIHPLGSRQKSCKRQCIYHCLRIVQSRKCREHSLDSSIHILSDEPKGLFDQWPNPKLRVWEWMYKRPQDVTLGIRAVEWTESGQDLPDERIHLDKRKETFSKFDTPHALRHHTSHALYLNLVRRPSILQRDAQGYLYKNNFLHLWIIHKMSTTCQKTTWLTEVLLWQRTIHNWKSSAFIQGTATKEATRVPNSNLFKNLSSYGWTYAWPARLNPTWRKAWNKTVQHMYIHMYAILLIIYTLYIYETWWMSIVKAVCFGQIRAPPILFQVRYVLGVDWCYIRVRLSIFPWFSDWFLQRRFLRMSSEAPYLWGTLFWDILFCRFLHVRFAVDS